MARRTRDIKAQERTQEVSKDLFAMLANETRIAILFALAEAERDVGAPVPFSEIYGRLEMRDSSKFNYHLKTLTDHLVRHTDDGYRLRYVGRLIYRAIKAGEYTGEHVLEPTQIDSQCIKCGAQLIARYVDGRLLIRCDDCDDLSYRITIPPGALIDRTPTEFLRAADQQIRSDITLAAHNVCSYCSGKTTPQIRDVADVPTDNIYVNHFCEQCGQRVISTTVGELFLPHPMVIAFCIERGVDLAATPCWEIDFCVTDDYITVVSEDPWLAEFEYSLGSDILRITMDETLATVETSVITDYST